MTPGQTDSELIARARADPAAFAGIFDRYHAELYRYLRRRLGPAQGADLAAEVFVTAFARRAAYRPQSDSARPWLYGIAHNLLRAQARRERRQRLAYLRHGESPAVDPAATAAFAQADARADAGGLAGLLARLPPGDRDVLLLFAWADMSYAEIATALEIPVGTVRSRLHRARRRLRPLLRSEIPAYQPGGNHG
jgi:RNA polymerase sigma-70 factor (ECF subfamily)